VYVINVHLTGVQQPRIARHAGLV